MKETYIKPQVTIEEFATSDVITTSTPFKSPWVDEDGWITKWY
ncbi:MAG: hypothetical protein ACLUFN_08925 [Eubacterium sp.]